MSDKEKQNHFTFRGKDFQPTCIVKVAKINKRYKLTVTSTKVTSGTEWLVILKNPSKAGRTNKFESDMTVNTVCTHFFSHKKSVKKVTIVNLFPLYLTDASKLRDHRPKLLDKRNYHILETEIRNASNIVLAWGASPAGCQAEFKDKKEFVQNLLKGKTFYQMKRKGKELNRERPLHGQVWRKDCELVLIK